MTDSATSGVVLVRESPGGPELLVSRRPSDRRFLAGFHGFIVGRTVRTDADVPFAPDLAFRVPDRRAWGCAIRELFEETGLLPLRSGTVATWDDEPAVPPPGEDWETFRETIRAEPDRFAAELRRAGLRADAHALRPVGDWPPPSWSPFEGRTEFFVCRSDDRRLEDLPDHVDPVEHREPAWESPESILQRWERGEWLLSTPIRLLVEGLRRVGSAPETRLLPASIDQSRARRECIQVVGGIRRLPLRTATLPPATHTNCYIVGRRGALVIDPGSEIPSERRLLDETMEEVCADGGSPRAIVLTHHHGDHVGAAAWLKETRDLEVWAHAETRRRIDPSGLVDRRLTDGEAVACDPDHPLRVLHTPGHAPGHLALVHEPSRSVFAGDLVASEGTILVDPEDGDMGAYLESLARLRALELSRLFPAHGEVVTAPEEMLDHYIDHRRERESQVLDALRRHGRPASPDDLVATVYADKPKSVWPLARRSLESHLLHLVERDLARRIGDEFVSI